MMNFMVFLSENNQNKKIKKIIDHDNLFKEKRVSDKNQIFIGKNLNLIMDVYPKWISFILIDNYTNRELKYINKILNSFDKEQYYVHFYNQNKIDIFDKEIIEV